MPVRMGPVRFPWGRSTESEDPYWEFFLNQAAGDSRNLVSEIIRRAPEGAVNPVMADLHTPEVTSSHIKEFARFLGADRVGIARLDSSDPEIGQGYPFAIVCAVRAENDPRETAGVGGQTPVQNGLFVTFILSAYIRELGYRATAEADAPAERLAAFAGLGTLDADGRLVVPKYGSRVHVANVIRTDLPLAADS